MEGTASAAEGRPIAKRQLRNYLLEKRFQMRWVLRVAVTTTVIVVVMGYFLYGTVADASDQLVAQQLGDLNLTDEAREAFIEQASRDKTVTMVGLIVGLVLLDVLLGLVTIVLTHRIAGPVFKIKRLLAGINNDSLQLWAKLRRGDELQDVFAEFDDMVRRLREDRRADIDELRAVREQLGAESPAEAVEKLETLINRYQASVKME